MQTDVTIIGAGVVGLAIAAEVSKKHETVVVEKNHSHGQETSSRNSEIVHAGIYYPKNSLKAILCVEGNRLLYELCEENNIPHKKTGKLIVSSANQVSALESLLASGIANGVTGLEIIDEKKIKSLEPRVRGEAALYSPNSGIVDVHALMVYFESMAHSNGCLIGYNSNVSAIERIRNVYEIIVSDEKFSSRVVINSAGLHADKIAQLVGVDIGAANYRLHYCKGEYFYIRDSEGKVNSLVYPLPHENLVGLGVHSSVDMSGMLRLGPNAFYVDKINYDVDESHKPQFVDSAKELFDFVTEENIFPGFAGIRPKLQGPNERFRDFVIVEETEKCLPGFINLLGIESPGLTASPAIAKYVAEMVDDLLSSKHF